MASRGLPALALTAKRIGQLRRRVKTKRFAKKAAAGAAVATGSFLLDFLSGFLDIDLKKGSKDKLGIFGKALGAGVSGSADDTLPLPTMETPERVAKENDPTIATISKQLDTLVKTANKIGVYTKEQQDALLNQIKQSKRVASEQQLEQKAPILPELPEAGQSGAGLAPLDNSVADLITRIDELSETLDGMSPGGGGGMGAGGLLAALGLGSLLGGRGKAPKVEIDESKLVDRKGNPLTGRRRDARIRQLTRQATAAAAPARSGIARRAAAGIASTAASSRIANFMRSGIRPGGGAAAGATRSAVRAIAGPLIKKGLGRTVLKSIPIIGTAAAAFFAIGRLLKGDVVGAGLDLTSGLGGPLTAIPAFGAAVTRDTYASVYGVQPEQDPNFSKNFPELKKTIEDLIREELGQSVKPKNTPTESEIGEAETPKVAPMAAPAAAPPPAIPNPSAPPAAAGQGASDGAAAAGSSTGSGAAAAAASSAGASPQAQQEMPAANAGQALSQATMDTSQGMTGAMMTGQAPLSQDWMDSYGYDTDAGAFMPQTSAPVTRSGRQYIGNIPSPVYDNPDLIDFKKTLFFDY